MIVELEREHYYTLEKIKQIQETLDRTKISEIQESGDKHDL